KRGPRGRRLCHPGGDPLEPPVWGLRPHTPPPPPPCSARERAGRPGEVGDARKGGSPMDDSAKSAHGPERASVSRVLGPRRQHVRWARNLSPTRERVT